ncbi:MAG TPA: CsoS2 family carboxysome shell protein, partial [Cyanobium sp.]|nr:CsoS2 family carboxysome shell protein [Cyanobium sp.]
AADAKPARTEPRPAAAAAAPVTAIPQRSRPAARSGLSVSTPSSAASRGRANGKPLANPSRELVLARREALSRRGKRADASKDRTRTDLQHAISTAPSAPSTTPASSLPQPAVVAQSASLGLGSSLAARNVSDRRNGKNRSAQYNPSRALVLARREALSKRGKSASIPGSTSTAAVARQGNPDLSTRELAQKVRDLKSRVGSAGSTRNGGCRPSGPNRNGSRQEAALAALASTAGADAHWKVGVSATTRGQVVTGTQANRSGRTTGNEASTCRAITGTEYLGAEIFNSFCQSGPLTMQPDKVRVSSTSHGNIVTGNEVGRSEKVTGDEPGTCKNVTGTEYISANQSAALCGVNQPSPRKVGHSQTLAGRPVSGVIVGRSERVTGDEPGSGRHLTGTQYVNEPAQVPGRAPTKVSTLQTLRGTAVTGTHVGRSEFVTGDEPGSCRMVTGDEYIGTQQFEGFCGVKPAPEPAKVGFSVTNRSQVVSGTRTGRSEKVTGDEPGTCKAITGTPYAGLEEAGGWCPTTQVNQIRQRTPARLGTRMSGIQPGIGGVMTGAGRGACEDITGTPYVGGDQLVAACGTAPQADADFPQPLTDQPWQQFSVQSPAQAAQLTRQRSATPTTTPGGVTGTSYELGNRIT